MIIFLEFSMNIFISTTSFPKIKLEKRLPKIKNPIITAVKYKTLTIVPKTTP